jgi:hypothetical protein
MNDTVQSPATEQVTGNDGATDTSVSKEGTNEGQPTNATAPQSDGQNDTSANPNDKDTSSEDGGKVTDADKDNTDDSASKEGGEQGQDSVIDLGQLKLPDGVTVTDEEKEAFRLDAEAIGIKDNAGAQKFLDWILNKSKEGQDNFAKQQENDIGALEKSWTEEGKKDPVLGKEYDKNVSDAMETASKIFSPRTIEFLKDTRFTSNPDFLKDMLRLAKERADAELIMGKSPLQSSKVQRDSHGNPMLTFK